VLDTIRRTIGIIERGARGPWIVVLVLAVVVSFVEAAGALLMYVVVAAFTRPEDALDLPVVGDLRERFPGVPENTLFRYLALVVAIFFVVRTILYLGQTYLQYRAAYSTGASISGRLLRGYLGMPYAWHLRQNSAQMVRNAYDSVNQLVLYVLPPLVMVVAQGLIVLAIGIVLLVVAPIATLFIIVALGGVVFVLMRFVQPRLHGQGETYQEMAKRSFQSLQQSLHGIRDIKLLGREEYFRAQFERSQDRIGRTQYIRQTLFETPRVAVENLVILLLLAYLAVVGIDSQQSEESLAVIGLFAYAALRLLPAFNRMILSWNHLRYGSAAVRHVADDLEMFDVQAPLPAGEPATRLELREAITLEGVSFRYEGGDREVLEDIDLVVGAGESVGLVGPTGGGKTTLVDTILGLLQPTSGTVKVDGVDIRTNLRGWHATLGVVPQGEFLIDDTLRRNIALGVPDDEIDGDAVDEALHLAQLDEFARALPDGLDTVIGERGERLSGGQRQRVAIARALYRRPAVIAFDEGTSALDSHTEGELIAALEGLRGERTLISVAHRITTVQRCDRILLVERGRIVDGGSYDDLRARNADFRRLAG
jgi:ABC-type multidrug transport system fused ATPase/permease subunit